ncbi:MAG: hypothetical protein DCO96_02750 [Fluviicola sp. XM-24bin1]|nr:MAG: hypothetical protein DCO96_02750 [Fluviicola sp. XM-24bin1]
MKKQFIVLIAVTSVFLTSCLKDEIPVPQHNPGDVILNSYEMGTDYRYNAYYDFETNTFVKEHLKTDWDLGFETGILGWRIVLNNSKAMNAGASPISDFEMVSDTMGVVWKSDASSWNLDTTAIGDWRDFPAVYCIDRGFSFDGTHLGYKKLEIESVNSDFYAIRYSNLDGSDEITTEVPKNDDNFNFSFFSFDSNDVASIEPEKESWDLVFRQYTHTFDDGISYLVNGVLSNSHEVEVAEIFHKEFEDVQFEDINTVAFSSDIDVIGYDWKTFNGADFDIHPEQVYIVKTTEGLFYKLRFVDFYNAQGEKGTPTFEMQAL